MAHPAHPLVASAQAVLPAADLDDSIRFFRDELGFRLDRIFPADAPRVAVMSGHGLTVRLDTGARSNGAGLRLETSDDGLLQRAAAGLAAPGGTPIEIVPLSHAVEVPPLASEFRVTRAGEGAAWVTGRAGMQYRDLVPGRLGGAVIASHIRIPEGGPVPDYVHHHHVRFQLIFCLRGWTRLVYEDQGPAFVMQAGDCVLQPTHIRHRVLECSDGFEVVEIGCPAEHETLVDHELPLPNERVDRDRDFSGQRFVFSEASKASWSAMPGSGLEFRDTGIAGATGGLLSVVVKRPAAGSAATSFRQSEPFRFGYVLSGRASLAVDKNPAMTLDENSAFVLPIDSSIQFEAMSPDLEWLEVTADF